MSICLSVYLSIYHRTNLSVYASIHLSIYQYSINQSINLSINLSIYQSIYLYLYIIYTYTYYRYIVIYNFIYIYIYLSPSLSLCLSLSIAILGYQLRLKATSGPAKWNHDYQIGATLRTILSQYVSIVCSYLHIPPKSPHYHRPHHFGAQQKAQKTPFFGTFDEDFADSAQILKLRVVPCPCQTWRWGSDILLIKFRPSKVQKIHIWNCGVWLGLDWTWETCNSMKRRVLLFEVSAMHAKTLDSF